MLQEQMNQTRRYVHAKQKTLMYKTFLHRFCLSMLTSKQLYCLLGFFYRMLFPLRTDHSWKCFSNQWKWDRETENPQRKDKNKKNALMKKRQTHPLWSGTNVPTKQIINRCNHKRTAMYTLNDFKMLLICYSKNYRYTHQDNARLYHVSQTCSYISEGRLTSRCSQKGRKSF